MLKRLYVDNYKGLVNFEMHLGGHALLLGSNGSGKSSVLDVVMMLVRFVSRGSEIRDCLTPNTRTRWDLRRNQSFELDVEGPVGVYTYRLEVEYGALPDEIRTSESLCLGTTVLFRGDKDSGELHRDDGSIGPGIFRDWTKSTIPLLRDHPTNQKLMAFRELMRRIHMFRPDPRAMTSRTEGEATTPSLDLTNFASWWRHIWQDQPELMQEAVKAIADTLPGLRSLSIQRRESDEVRVLRSRWDVSGSAGKVEPAEFTFDELSDGQRVVVALQSVAKWLSASGGVMLLDEPDNFVALAEIQPLIRGLLDAENVQLIVASHHPEILNEMAIRFGVRLWRDQNGPVRNEKFSPPRDTLLTPAELVASRMDASRD